ncbi:hypothetical protein [Streptomyces sp. NRRL F-2664]|uniref:hypothetical protein n=1 Tax=Streptomyces sp. NRRL F-2664 TaxID=1463842 RepID=UPI00131D0BDF|nr:hypothetical protein [Streptomyces sp. NRRL F-2664]
MTSNAHDAERPASDAASAPQGQLPIPTPTPVPTTLPDAVPSWHVPPLAGEPGKAPVSSPSENSVAEHGGLSLQDALAKAKEAIAGNPELKDCSDLALISLYGKDTSDVNDLKTWQFSFAEPAADSTSVHKTAVVFVDSASGQVTVVQAASPSKDRLPSPLPAMTPDEAVKLAQSKGMASSFWRIDLQSSGSDMDGHPFFAIYPHPGPDQSVYVDTVTGNVIQNP